MKTRNFYDHILTFRDRGETKMKLPKKLEPWTRIEPGTGTLQDKINEIIDYLSDKEGGEAKTGIPMGKHPIATKDCSVCKAKKGWIHLYEECTPKVACKSCGAEMIETEHYIGSKKLRSDFNCSKCGLSDLDKPQLKEESPKEDEWIDDLYENFSSHWDKNGRSLETFIRNILSLAQQRTEKKCDDLKDYCVHQTGCPLAYWEAGRPTNDGGYETKWSGKWYKEPKRPKCTCGLSDLLK